MDTTKVPSHPTLLHVLRHRASAASGCADSPAFTYLNDGDTVSGVLSYAQLDQRARAIAAALQRVTRHGDRVLLVMPPCLEYIEAFYGCVYAGVIAVPAVSPTNARTLPRLHLIAADAGARVALTRSDTLGAIHKMQAQASDSGTLQQIDWLAVDALDAAADDWQAPALGPDDLVFLQYTSGSTGTPKGVMVSHANLLANVELSRVSYGLRDGDTFISWLPPHHDFGLIGAIIFPVVTGCHSVQFPPAAFLMRPYRWLRLIHEYRGNITGAPNFAYALCAERITEAEKQTLDLSCMRVAVNGAERVRAQTLRDFAAAFASCGFQASALTPAYGMAESVLFVSAVLGGGASGLPKTMQLRKQALDAGRVEACPEGEEGFEAVATGHARTGDHHLAIVDPASGRELPDGQVGEVWIHGASVAQGYWGREADSAAAFRATLLPLAPDLPTDGWLRSGDLGFVRDGELYITGRSKEVMIFNGRNLYPQDVEMTVERLDPAFRANGCVAFALEDGAQAQLVIVQEVESRRQAAVDTLIGLLRAELAERHEIFDLAAVVLVRPGRVPRTSSGKLQRLRCRELYLAGDIDAVWSWRAADEAPAADAATAPSTDTERRLLQLWETVLGQPGAGVTDNFFRSGGHSLQAAQLAAGVREAFQVELPLRTLFVAPTVQALAREIDAARAGERGTALPGGPRPGLAAEHAATGAGLPLSHAQERFWFLDQYQPGNPFYSIPLALTVQGEVDTAALRSALDQLAARHETLRTAFPAPEGIPRQAVLPPGPVPFTEASVAASDAATLRELVRETLQREAERPFDLANGPLLRAALLHTGPAEHVLLLTLHHVIHDGWSTRLLIDELQALYGGARTGTPAPQPAALQYADYAVWERRRFDGEHAERLIAHWRDALAGAPTLLALPTDRPRTALASQRGAAWTTRLGPEAVQRVAELARRQGATPFMVLATAFGTLLHRLSGQEDFCFGVMSANRPAGTEALLGNFVNVVPMRVRMATADRFEQALSAMAAQVLSAYEHQLPFELVRQHVAPRGTAGQAPYAQVVINYHSELDAGAAAAPQGALQITGRHEASITHAAFDLKLEIHAAHGALDLAYEYSTDLFDEATVARLAGHFEQLLAAACEAPSSAVGRLNLLAPAEWDALRHDWQASTADYPRDAAITELFAAQAARTPDALAVCHRDQRVNYRELDERSNRLAHLLQGHGVGPDTLVAVCVERSVETIVAVLGVLKAGGAYVPVDPAYPAARIEYMLQDSAAAVLLTQRRLVARLPATQATVLALDDIDPQLAAQPAGPCASQAGAAHLAYMIYTSGSTGRPKGAMVHRHGLLNLLWWYLTQFKLGAQDKTLVFSSFSFDLTQKNLIAPLLVGGQVHLPEEGYDPAAALATIEREGITFVNCAPSAFYPLLADGGARRLGSLRQVFLGGEPINTKLVHEALAGSAHAPLVHNTYGPTEASDVVSFFTWDPRTPRATLPIGRAVSNMRLYVLDAGLQPVPPGVVGELYIGGDGVGRGYHQRPELTAERFIDDPFAGTPGARMYRSGDLVRRLPDGDIDYLGRIDHQVKVRGFRIELGEIEESLAALPEVRQSVVVALPGEGGEHVLAAYVVAAAEGVEPSTLRALLSRSLPAFMVPSHIVMLPALPLTPNGKVDRSALPQPQATTAEREVAPPRTPTEEAMAGLWAALLGHARIGRDDHFFELGGHSLLATQLVSNVRVRFGVELPVRALFEQPVLALLCERIDAARQGSAPADDGPVADEQAWRQPEPPAFAEQRLWFLEQLAAGQAVYNLPVGLRLDGPLDLDALQRSVDALVQRHDALRTCFGLDNGQPVRRVAEEAHLRIEFADLSSDADAEAAALREMQQAAVRPFDLQAAPLLRVAVWRTAPQRHLLLLNMHHVVSDGWSLGVLHRDLSQLYAALSNVSKDQPSPLTALPVRYADHARWQRRLAAEGRYAPQREHWLQRLAAAPTSITLPLDRPRPPVSTHRGAVLRFEVPAALTTALKAKVQQQGATLFMGLAAAYGLLLSRYAGQDELLIGTPVANRTHAAVEDLIGFFVNTLVLRLQLEGRRDFDDLLAHVREVTLDAYDHQDLPFDQLVAELDRGRRNAGSPLFQVMLALQSAPRYATQLGGHIDVQPVEVDTGTSKFDLTLDVTEAADTLACRFEYSTDLFDAATIERFAQGYLAVLEAGVAGGATPLDRVDALSAPQRDQLLHHTGTGRTLAGTHTLLHSAFERWAARQPEAPALIGPGDDEQLSYAQLDERANRLAHALRAAGVGPDRRVAVYVDRGVDLAVAFLAVLKAGGTYVPCDPAYPAERLAHMLRDSAPTARLTQARHLDALQALHPGTGLPTFMLDEPASWTAAQGERQARAPEVAGLQPQHGAYVIYTSGSTGQPKGVLVPHAGICNLALDQNEVLALGPGRRVLQFASMSFDASVWEMVMALASGAALVLAERAQLLAGAPLMDTLRARAVTHTLLPPSVLATMQDEPALQPLTLLSGGEACPPAVARHWGTRHRLVNAYGPTEISVCATTCVYEPQDDGLLPIGRPVANTRLYLLDRGGRPVPMGAVGEIHIGGAGVARGYLNLPQLTAERFLRDPFAAEADARMYRTGDLGRWLPDGRLLYLGRNDHQVKLRGHRIELPEIEARLRACTGIVDAAVLLRHDPGSEPRLAAYFIAAEGAVPAADTLRAELRSHLPEVMVPSAFVALEAWPLTPNGKLDRAALPLPQQQERAAGTAPELQGEVELQLAAVWAELLGTQAIGRTDSFFELGGHSLALTQLSFRIKEQFGVNAGIAQLYELQTLERMARHIEEARAKSTRQTTRTVVLDL